MLAMRLQRTGRSGHAQFRLVVQDSRVSPTRGRVVAYLGSYNPHSKAMQFDAEQISKYLDNGAQPSDRVAKLLEKEGIKMPGWVKISEPKERSIRNAEKLRRNRPAQAEAPAEEVPAPAEEVEAASEAPATETANKAEAPAEEAEAEPEASEAEVETAAPAESEQDQAPEAASADEPAA